MSSHDHSRKHTTHQFQGRIPETTQLIHIVSDRNKSERGHILNLAYTVVAKGVIANLQLQQLWATLQLKCPRLTLLRIPTSIEAIITNSHSHQLFETHYSHTKSAQLSSVVSLVHTVEVVSVAMGFSPISTIRSMDLLVTNG